MKIVPLELRDLNALVSGLHRHHGNLYEAR
jgi:hypothetical protein